MATGPDLQSWSTTPLSNGNADPTINFLENQTRASLNDSCRAVMAALALDRNLKNGSITTGGSSAAQTFTSGVGYLSYPTGLRCRLKLGFTVSGAFTINMDALGAKPVKTRAQGSDPAGGTLFAGQMVDFIFDGSNWLLDIPNSLAATFAPANPTGSAVSTEVMMGCGSTVSFTPLFSTRLLVHVHGDINNNIGGTLTLIKVRIGTGGAPANGAAAAGTLLGPTNGQRYNSASGLAISPFSQTLIATVVAGTTYWADISLTGPGAGTTTTVYDLIFTVAET